MKTTNKASQTTTTATATTATNKTNEEEKSKKVLKMIQKNYRKNYSFIVAMQLLKNAGCYLKTDDSFSCLTIRIPANGIGIKSWGVVDYLQKRFVCDLTNFNDLFGNNNNNFQYRMRSNPVNPFMISPREKKEIKKLFKFAS